MSERETHDQCQTLDQFNMVQRFTEEVKRKYPHITTISVLNVARADFFKAHANQYDGWFISAASNTRYIEVFLYVESYHMDTDETPLGKHVQHITTKTY